LVLSGLWNPYIGFGDADAGNTYAALTFNRDAVLNALHQRYAALNAAMEYDCNRFDKHGLCLSFQARATGWGNQSSDAGVLNAAYRVTDKVRAGVYLDYQAAQATPLASNTLTGGVKWNHDNPTFGAYIGWSDSPDGTGVQARVSGGYSSGELTITRGALNLTEPGSGAAGLNGFYAYGLAGYGVPVGHGIVVTPYGGLRFTDVTRDAYSENFNPSATIYPISYDAYYEQLITGLSGVKIQAMLGERLGCQAGLGGEFDFSRNASGYNGSSQIPGMAAWAIAHGGTWNGVRPAGSAGVFYNFSEKDRLSLNGYMGEQAWTSRSYETLLAEYRMAF